MPTYEYKCLDCGDRFETVQRMTDSPLVSCPECSGSLRRLIGAGAGLIFKGSGFYITDYRGDNYKKAAEKEAKERTKKSKETSSSPSTSSSKKKSET